MTARRSDKLTLGQTLLGNDELKLFLIPDFCFQSDRVLIMRDGWNDLVQHVSVETSEGFVVEFTPVFKGTDVGIAGMDRIRPW